MHPYAARQLLARLRDADLAQLQEATGVLADLEVACRGGADYGDDLALTLGSQARRPALRPDYFAAALAAIRAALAFLRAPVF